MIRIDSISTTPPKAGMDTTTWRPRIKPEHGLRRTPTGTILVGGKTFGIAAAVDDPTGSVWTLLTAADGTRTDDELVDHVIATHPGETRTAVLAALRSLIEAGYLENANADPAGLSHREQQRYASSRRFYRWIDQTPRSNTWEPQICLQASKVTIIGLGGTGGAAALTLAASGVGHLHLVDFDEVEESNLGRQIVYTEADLGQPKIAAATGRLHALNSNITITGEKHRITSEDDLHQLAANCDVLLLCADQPTDIRAWTNTVCLAYNRPWAEAGYHGPLTQAAAYIPGHGPCWMCTELHEQEQHPDTGVETHHPAQAGRENAVTAASAVISGTLAAHLTLALLTGLPAITPGRIQGVNLVDPGQHLIVDHPQHPNCPACSNHTAG